MNVTLPSGRKGQALAVLLVLLAFAVAWRLVLAPSLDLYQERTENLEHRSAVAARLEKLGAELPRLKASLASGDGSAGRVQTLEGATDAIAAATLQSNIQDMAGTAGAALGSTELLQAEATAGTLRRIGIKATFSGDMATIMHLLQAVEQALPPMLIDDLQIHATIAPIPGGPLRLDASFAVYAFRNADSDGQKP